MINKEKLVLKLEEALKSLNQLRDICIFQEDQSGKDYYEGAIASLEKFLSLIKSGAFDFKFCAESTEYNIY